MWVAQKLCLSLIFITVFARRNLKIIQEKLSIDYADPQYVDAKAELVQYNTTTKGIIGHIMLKFDIPKNLRYYGAVQKWVNNGYNLNLGHVEDTMKGFTTTEYFGIADLCLRKTEPPVVWPLKKGVTYRIKEPWTPDPSSYPPQFPEGKWKILARMLFANKTKIGEVTWYLSTFYE